MTAAAPAGRRGLRRSVLRDADFRRLWAGMTVSRLGSSVAAVTTPLIAVQVLDAGAFGVSLLTAAAWLPWLLIGLPAGAWIDRVARRPVMLISDLIAAALVISVPVAAWLGRLTMAHLLAVALLLGVATVFFTVAWTAYLPAMFDADDLVEANSALQGTESAAQVAGPAAGGLLIAAVSAVAGLVVDALSFLFSAFMLWRIRRAERRPAVAGGGSIWREIAAGVRWLLRDRFLRNLTAYGAAANLWLTGMNAITVVFLVREVGVSTAGVGMLLAAVALGGVGAAAVTPRLVSGLGGARALVACKVFGGVASLLVPLTRPGPGLCVFVAGMLGIAAGAIAGNVVTASFRQAYVPAGLLGRVLTGMQFVNYGAIPVGAVLGGAAAGLLGTRGAMWIMAIGYALSGLILLLGPLRGRRDLPVADVALAG
ncbi:MFS transporter [Amorphoplanes digitatis]|uniref:MFS family permease n=1 Tax=Actinoplanes digitatis TaxID=1868 RepID=A0A7W7MNK8_9ACTN|nr:MFS transporter [Actinoplanes digitatis]MBB4760777.1 MFS family permease [Actinoplanes digitatis]GID94200.1 MFS transporter [Actinoplanes digitatis]